ncbi:MAG: hypothetical protein RL367_1618 [Pseudomonadota bacterium]|jgi:hypothetical protein
MIGDDAIKLLLLDMLSSARSPDPVLMARLHDSDWDTLGHIARQHRVEPLLFEQGRAGGWPVPATLRATWSDAYRRAAMKSLSLHQVLGRLHMILEPAGIDYAALKGAWLAWQAYPHPALRPMRDIDILVAHENALAVNAALLANGFELRPDAATPLDFAHAHEKHLPPLRHSITNVSVEIHTRLTDYAQAGVVAQLDFDNVATLLGRSIRAPLGRHSLPFLSATDSLLHLIIHTAHDHGFNNGPLVYNDIAVLLRVSQIDWGLFWQMADANLWSRGCQLILALTEFYHGMLGIVWPDQTEAVAPELLRSVALLSLQDHHGRGEVALLSAMGNTDSLWGRLQVMIARLFPSRHVIAAHANINPDSAWVWTRYPLWLFHRAGQVASSLSDAQARQDARHATRVMRWMAGAE